MTVSQTGGPVDLALAVQIIDKDGQNNLVLERDASFDLKVTIDVTQGGVLGGTLRLQSFMESIGPGFEGEVGPAINIPVTGLAQYVATITGTAPVDAGPYKLVTVVTHRSLQNKVTALAAFEEGPIVLVIDQA